jgi:Mrp family chromosome partitioning ATPase
MAFADQKLADLYEAVQSLTLQVAQAKLGTSAIKLRQLESALEEAKSKAESRYRNLLNARAAGISIPNIPMINDDNAIKKAQANLDYLTDDSEKLKVKLLEIGGHNRDLQKLHDQEDELQSQLKRIKGRLEQLSVEKPIQNRVELVKLGDMPLVADKDTRPKYGAVGGFGGLMAATGLVMLMGYLSGKVKAPDDLLFDLGGQPLIGLIPQLQKGNDASKLAATAAEYVHRSRTMLEIWAQGNQKMVIGVTSPSHGSGNTSVAMSLGVSFATAGLKTLLIDVDFVTNGLTPRLQTMVRRELGKVLLRCGIITEEKLAIARKVMFEEAGGKVNDGLAITASANGNGHNGHHGHNGNGLNGMHVTNAVNPSAGTNKDKALGAACVKLGFITQEQLDKALKIQAREPVGLLDALSGEPLDNCIGKTGIRNLSLLPRGNVTPAHAAKLSSHSMRQVLAAARQNFDTVIVDTSAIPTSLEAAIVASTVDGMVMTVARGEKRSRLMDAMERLEAMGCPVAGVIFNHVRPKDMPPELNIGRVSTMNANAEDEETIRANAELVGRLAMLGPLASTMVSRVPLLDDKVSEDDQ